MTKKFATDKISGLSSTLLIPLWAKAVEYGRAEALLKDPLAFEMMQRIDFDFSKFDSAVLSQVGCCGRAAVFDNEARRFIERYPDAVIVQLGAGLDARFERLGKPKITAWYDLDLPEVIAVRQRLLPEVGNHYLADSLFNPSWMETVAAYGKPILLLIEGVLMYFEKAEVQNLFRLLADKLSKVTIVLDLLPPLAIGKAKRHDALKNIDDEQRPEFLWAEADAKNLERWQAGLTVQAQIYLSDVCATRYPWFMRAIYRMPCGKRYLDPRIVRLELAK